MLSYPLMQSKRLDYAPGFLFCGIRSAALEEAHVGGMHGSAAHSEYAGEALEETRQMPAE